MNLGGGLRAALAVAVLFAASPAAAERRSPGCDADRIAKGERQEMTVQVDGLSRSFLLDVPTSIEARQPVPLLFDFHGFGHSAAGVWRISGFRELGVRERFITVYPQGLDVRLLGRDGPGWDMNNNATNRDLAFMRRMLDDLEKHFCIDEERIYATGFSNGAFFSHLLGCVMPDQIAAIAIVSGGALPVACEPARPVPVLIYHGRKDPIVPVDKARELFAQWKTLDGCGADRKIIGTSCSEGTDCKSGGAVVYCENDLEHRWPPEATARIWEFLLQNPQPKGPAEAQK